jgi:hypothetical protein
MVNTENGVIGDSKEASDIGQLPMNFRAVTTSPLATLQTSAIVQQDSQGNIALGGATANMVGYSVDGISTANVFLSASGANPYPSSEGIAELKVTAFNNTKNGQLEVMELTQSKLRVSHFLTVGKE